MTGETPSTKLGIIAGGGALPGLLASACAASERPYYILALTGFAEVERFLYPPDTWIRLGEIGKGFDALKEAEVGEVVMAGAVRHPTLTDLKPDLKGAALLARIAGRALGDDGLLSVVIAEIEREGFKVVGVDDILTNLLAKMGPLGRYAPDEEAEQDIACGFDAARALGLADIGQAAVVQQGIVLGLESAEGTDALLQRCKVLRRNGPGGVLVKAKKPQQERRADLPTIGVATVKNAHAAGLRGIAVEAGHTLIIDQARVAELANQFGLFVVGRAKDEPEVTLG
jgi:DUF1009 family protein